MIINRGGEQGAQHAQSLQSLFAHCPGLKVVYPSTPKSIYGEIVAAASSGNITVLFEDRALYGIQESFYKSLHKYYVDEIRRREKSKSKVIISDGRLANLIETEFPSVSVYSVANLSKVDWGQMCEIANSYNEILVCEDTWRTCSFSSEILANLMLNGVKARTRRLNLPDLPAPTHREYEKQYFIGVDTLEKFIFQE